MKATLLFLAHLSIFSCQPLKQANTPNCKQAILRQLVAGKLFSDTLNLSGKYLNELGNYDMCVKDRNGTGLGDMKYELKTYKSDKPIE